MKDENDDALSFIKLAAVTANVVGYLQLDKKQNEQLGDDAAAEQQEKQRIDEHRQYVLHRLREIARWERKMLRR